MLLSKDQTTDQILLSAMAIIVGIRVTAFITEKVSTDLAKLIPMGLLGVVIIQPGYLGLGATANHIGRAFDMWPLLVRYFATFLVLEMIMHSLLGVRQRATTRWDKAASQSRYTSPRSKA